MSLGPSSLGNLLVQRLDTALGVSQPAQNRTGAHPDALRQSQPAHRLNPNENQRNRTTQESVDKARQQSRSTGVGRQDARLTDQLKSYTDNRFTASAPTTLGRTARTLLTLLNSYSNQPVQGRQPLMQPQQLAQLVKHATPSHQNAQANRAPTTQSGQPSNAAAAASQSGRLASTPPTISASTTAATASATTASATTGASTPALSLTTLANTIGGATTLVNAFTQALTQNVQQSGMFYESHLAKLVKGQADPAQLRQQPQAELHHQSQQVAAKSAKGSSLLQGKAPAEPLPSTTLQQAGIDPSAQQLVRQQLDVLANQLFMWRGEAWPGAMMEWEIQRRHEEESQEKNPSSDNPDDLPWQTRLRVDLPRLGEVETRLYIDDKKLRMHIRAPAAATHLTDNMQQLVQRLQAQGLQIEQFQISRQDELQLDPPLYVHESE
ncbi:flagellar hook-length control protein FliK [Paenalcaligenes faecalis]|uniref:flagellar hook-length control protein FliK n=1 Tax=Paenalcaligenes faecalis TaxID=2980099 RepID=UPI0022B98B93|nr:flagellar hook-length control protein FliK [Paenalcaligenes faecalis]